MNRERIFSLTISLLAVVCLTSCAELLKAQTDKVAQQEKTFQEKQAQLEAELNATGKVICAKRAIPEGKTITAADTEERDLPQNQIPIDALSAKSQAIGRTIKHEFSKDDVLCQHRLMPIPLK